MRQEAIERVRSMQRRSRAVVTPQNDNNNDTTQSGHELHNAKENVPPVPQKQDNNQNHNHNTPNMASNQNNSTENPIANILGNLFPSTGGQTKKGPLSELFDGFNISEENALIGILIYILAKNGADVKLLLGLGYLLL